MLKQSSSMADIEKLQVISQAKSPRNGILVGGTVLGYVIVFPMTDLTLIRVHTNDSTPTITQNIARNNALSIIISGLAWAKFCKADGNLITMFLL